MKLKLNKKQYNFSFLGLCLCWFAVILQFVLMLQNRVVNVPETIIRFFSYFTILTNLLVAIYFTYIFLCFKKSTIYMHFKAGSSTAITAFILIVGLVYQFVLRTTWQPKGLQILADELLHSVIPIFMFIYWILFAKKEDLVLSKCLIWLLYPILYIVLILIRGCFSQFYPYPFIDVNKLGYPEVFLNIILLTLFFLIVFGILIALGKRLKKTI